MREFRCGECGQVRQHDKPRGPLPKTCSTCNPDRKTHTTDKDRAPRKPNSLKPSALATREKAADAIKLRIAYVPWEEIARQLSFGSHTQAIRAVRAEQLRRQAEMDEGIDILRNREVERLEMLGNEALKVLRTKHLLVSAGQVVMHELADGRIIEMEDDGPKLQAIAVLLKVSESYRKLLGLDTAQKVDASVTVHYSIKGIPESEMP